MKFLPTLALLFAFQCIHAQAVERWEYLRINGLPMNMPAKSDVIFDDGSKVGKAFSSGYSLKDSTGTTLKFNSTIDALNYLGNQGWECFSLSTVSHLGSTTDVFYFKRRKR